MVYLIPIILAFFVNAYHYNKLVVYKKGVQDGLDLIKGEIMGADAEEKIERLTSALHEFQIQMTDRVARLETKFYMLFGGSSLISIATFILTLTKK